MSKIDEIRAEMVKAMKEKDKERKDSLSMLLSALKNKAIDKREDLTEDEENEVIKKEIRQTRETLESAPADRTDIKEQCEKTSCRISGICSCRSFRGCGQGNHSGCIK